MRIAVLIIGLLLGLVMFLQTFVVYVGSSATEQEDLAGSAAVGVVMAILWLVACALVIPFPLVSVGLFTVAGLFGILGAVTSEFGDLYVWAVISFVLALMSFFGWRGKKKDQRAADAERVYQRERDARMESLLTQQQWNQAASTGAVCPSCGTVNPAGTKFCGECGGAIASAAV